MKFKDRLAAWPRLGVTSVLPTEAPLNRFTPKPTRFLVFNNEPLGCIDLVLEGPLMAGLDGIQHAGAMAMVLAEILDAMAVPAGETSKAQAERRERVRQALGDASEALEAFNALCVNIQVANLAAKNSVTGKVRPS